MKTAVEWFAKELYEKFEMRGDGILYDEILEQAKAMEKDQIIKSNRDGVDMVIDGKLFITGEQYYNETYKNTNDV